MVDLRPSVSYPSARRAGFTLIEALVAVGVLVIALGGIGALAANITRRASTPDDLVKAAYFAAERMHYFRAQAEREGVFPNTGAASGYTATGGTYYPPPIEVRPGYDDPNKKAAFHNTDYNKLPTRLVREYLYDGTESYDFDALSGVRMSDRNRKRRMVPGRRFAYNEIPVTPGSLPDAANVPRPVKRVRANDETAAAPDTPTQQADPDQSWIVTAPRANDHLRGNGFSLQDRSIRFVREVWVQPNHPMFPAAGAAPAVGPRFVLAPPYSVVVTVRVYRRDPRVTTFAAVAGAGAGPGYDANKPPLSELIGVIGLP